MAQVYNLTSEINNLNPLIDNLFNDQSHVTTNQIDHFLNQLEYDDLKDSVDLTQLLVQLAVREQNLDENLTIDTQKLNDEPSDLIELIHNTFGDGVLQIERIDKNSNLYQWLLNWYDNKPTKLIQTVRSAYLSDHALYYLHGIGYDALDSDLLGGNGNGNTYKQFMHQLNQ